jgi:hypothetical protein
MTLIEEFVKKGIINRNQAFSVEEDMSRLGKSIDEILLKIDIDPTEIINVKKDFFSDIEYASLDYNKSISESILEYIPVESVDRYKIVPLGISSNDELEVGMLNPEDLTAKTILQFISSKIGKPYKIFLIS